jgi:FkbM family methyltransferase
MTTWTFNVVRELLSGDVSRGLWIEPASAEEAAFCSARGIVIGKCHHFSERLAACADVVVYSYRDIRTAAVSSHRKFGSRSAADEIEGWLHAEGMWRPHAQLVLRYEDVEAAPGETVHQLRKLISRLGVRLPVSPVADDEIVRRVTHAFERPNGENGEKAAYDPQTLVFPGHRTHQPAPDELPPDERAIYDRVEGQFRDWLTDHGYLAEESYGQSLEYAIAAATLRSMASPAVIDVGAERGSFMELALQNGAATVIGFEPLPRHLDHLRRRFAAAEHVRIHGLAVSDRSGSAQFHIATDTEGKELDFHHTLSDIGDSETVIRSKRSLTVQIATLADLARDGLIPARIDFLKIDTDGHDLTVLHGLGELRPRVVMAEYWDTLPESSGINPYDLRDIVGWGKAHGYSEAVVVRRNGRIQLVGRGDEWSVPGDWGNILLFRDDFALSAIEAQVQRLSRDCYTSLAQHVAALTKEREDKEAEIRRLDSDLKGREAEIARLDSDLKGRQDLVRDLTRQNEEKASKILMLEEKVNFLGSSQGKALTSGPEAEAVRALWKENVSKEIVIKELTHALTAYRVTFAVLGIFIVPLNHFVLGVKSVMRRSTRALTPRLGVLSQHEPCELRLPASYANASPVSPGPKISIVTPSFRQGCFIERTIQSVLAQGYPNLEYFIQDGGSDDNTREVLERYSSRLAGWDSRPDNGQTQAINRGFARTTGEIMAWLNSDDILFAGALAYVADYFYRHPKVDVVYGHRLLIDEDDHQIGRWMLPRHNDKVLSWADFVPQETMFFRRRIWERVGGRLDENFRFAMDWDLLVRFRDVGARFARVPRFIGGFRVHPNQKTSASISHVGFEEMDRIRKRTLGRVPSRVEVRKAVFPYLVRHVATDLGWRIQSRLGFHS